MHVYVNVFIQSIDWFIRWMIDEYVDSSDSYITRQMKDGLDGRQWSIA